MKRAPVARKIAIAIGIAVAVVMLGAALFWKETAALVQAYDALFKLVGLVIGPLLAVLGFTWGLVEKAEWKDKVEEATEARALARAQSEKAEAAQADVNAKVKEIDGLKHDLAAIADTGRLWKLRKNSPFPEYRGWKFDPEGAKIVTIGLFKGGVGKSHLAANFAAYVSERQRKPVLLIDLDFQGSVSASLLTMAGIEPTGSHVDALFSDAADIATLNSKRIHLAKHSGETTLNGGEGLSRAWLVPAEYTLAQVESQLLIDRVFNKSSVLDERYRLAHLLLHPHVRREYALIILDTPPRMTLGTVNALVASHCFIVPTILDHVSSEAVKPFLAQIGLLKSDLELKLDLAGIVASMTRQYELTGNEPRYWKQIEATAKAVIGTEADLLISRNLPRKTQVTENDDLGYFLRDSQGTLRERIYNPIFDELWTRIMEP